MLHENGEPFGGHVAAVGCLGFVLPPDEEAQDCKHAEHIPPHNQSSD